MGRRIKIGRDRHQKFVGHVQSSRARWLERCGSWPTGACPRLNIRSRILPINKGLRASNALVLTPIYLLARIH